jgi:hypothetical protein
MTNTEVAVLVVAATLAMGVLFTLVLLHSAGEHAEASLKKRGGDE